MLAYACLHSEAPLFPALLSPAEGAPSKLYFPGSPACWLLVRPSTVTCSGWVSFVASAPPTQSLPLWFQTQQGAPSCE